MIFILHSVKVIYHINWVANIELSLRSRDFVQSLGHVWLFLIPLTTACQASLSFIIYLSLLKLMSIESMMPSDHLTLVTPYSSCPPYFPALGSFPISWLFTSVGKVLELQLQHQSFQWIFRVDFLQDWLIWSPRSPRDSQESSPIPQFKSISSLALSLLDSPTLTSVHDYWKNHSFDYTDLCPLLAKWCLCFLIHYLHLS